MFKAFSDYAGDDKGDSGINRDAWHQYACRTAACFTVDVLRHCLGPVLTSKSYNDAPDLHSKFTQAEERLLSCFIESFPRASRFFAATAKQVFNSAIEELKQMLTVANWRPTPYQSELPVYRAKIGRGHQFLMRAKEVFNTARKIYAFSVR